MLSFFKCKVLEKICSFKLFVLVSLKSKCLFFLFSVLAITWISNLARSCARKQLEDLCAVAGVSVPVGSVPVIQTPGVSSRELSVSVITGPVLKQGMI